MLKRNKGLAAALAVALVSTNLTTTVTYANPNSYSNGVITIPSDNTQEYKNPFKLDENVEVLSKNLTAEVATIKDDVDTTTSNLVPIIVEFKTLPTIAAKSLSGGASTYSSDSAVKKDHEDFNSFLSSQASLYSTDKAKGLEKQYSINYSYYNTFNGVSMKIKGTDIPKLVESGVVKTIWSDKAVQLELPSEDSVATTLSEGADGITPYMAQSTSLIGAEKLHKEGIKGKGIKVGVLDTGVDYTHPDLKDNYKGGYDFVDNDADPMETTYKDWQNSGEAESNGNATYYTSHGTHVSGTVAGTGKNPESEMAVTGIAPEAELYAYRVLGPYGSGYTSAIIAGIEKSVADEMDVINLSLGAQINDPLFPTSVACNNAMLAGVTTVVANGNSGPNAGTVGSPGSADLPISVGASSTAIPRDKFKITANEQSFDGVLFLKDFNNEYKNLAAEGNEYKIVDCGLAEGFWDCPEDVKGNIALISRGEFTFNQKIQAATKAGAAGVIIYNNVEGEIPAYLGEQSNMAPAISTTLEVGQALLEIANSENNTISLAIDGEITTEADVLGDFSSRGPVSNGNIKPDVVAPGVQIFSTYPEYINSPEEGADYSTAYARIDGTSMAAPHVAGVSALILQQNKDYSPFDVKSALMNTSDDLKYTYAINETGAGRINAYDAVHSSMLIKVNDKTLNLDENDKVVEIDFITGGLSYGTIVRSDDGASPSINVALENNGDANKEFNVEVKFNGANQGALDAASNGVTLNIPSTLSVAAGNTTSLDVTLKIPAGAALGRYEGIIEIVNVADKNETYKIPFYSNYLEPSIISAGLSKNAVNNDIEMIHAYKKPGASAIFGVNAPFKTLHMVYRDYDFDTVIGYRGNIDGSMLSPDVVYEIPNTIDMLASYYPIKDGKLDPIPRRLTEGKYYIEYIVEGIAGKTVTEKVPFIVDNQDATISVDKWTPGAVEITEDMYEKTTTPDGIDRNVLWFTGTMNDNSLEILKSMGIEVDASSLSMGAYFDGMPSLFQYGKEDGSFKLGLEDTDIEMYGGSLQFVPFAMDIATSHNYLSLPLYNLMVKGTAYVATTYDKEVLNKGDVVNSLLSINNFTSGSKFKFNVNIPAGFELNSYKLNDEFQSYLDSNNYSVKLTEGFDVGGSSTDVSLTLEVLDSSNTPVNISGDHNVLDFVTTLVADNKAFQHYTQPIYCMDSRVENAAGEYVPSAGRPIYQSLRINMQSSALYASAPVYGLFENYDSSVPAAFEKFFWAEDSNGNKYEAVFDDGMQRYYIPELPVSTEEMKFIVDVPGHFRKEAVFVPSRTLNGDVVGNVGNLLGNEFGDVIYAGDVNKDDVVDVLDLLEIEKLFNKSKDEIGLYNGADLNADRRVNINDLDIFVECLGAVNEQAENPKTPTMTAPDGRTVDEILDSLGYNGTRATGVELNTTNETLAVGESFTLKPNVLPSDAVNKEFVWLMSADGEKYVDFNFETGEITAKAPGTVLVGAQSLDGGFQGICTIKITGEVAPEVAVEGFEFDNYDVKLEVDSTSIINAIITPENATNKNVTWYTSAPSIVTVENGVLTGKAEGTALVSATCAATRETKVAKVTVGPKTTPTVPVESIKLSKNKLKLKINETFKLTATLKPENATDKNVTWTSSNPEVAAVSDQGVVTATTAGTATITVTSKDGKVSDTCEVTVDEKEVPTVSVKSVKLDKNKVKLNVSETETLKVKINPSDATNQEVVFTSSDEKIATVDGQGVLKAISAGTTTITVTTVDGGFTDTCEVTVEEVKDPTTPPTDGDGDDNGDDSGNNGDGNNGGSNNGNGNNNGSGNNGGSNNNNGSGNNGNGNSNGSNNQGNNNKPGKLPQSGSPLSAAALPLAAVALIGAGAFVYKKKK